MSGIERLVVQQLLEQRSRGRFCSLRLSVGRLYTWAHASVLCPISEFIKSRYEAKKPYAKIDLTDLIPQDCFACLEKLLDIIYGARTSVENQHKPHVVSYCKLLRLSDAFSSIIFEIVKHDEVSDENPKVPVKLESFVDEMQIEDDECDSSDVSPTECENKQILSDFATSNEVNETPTDSEPRKPKRSQNCVGCRFKCFKTLDLLNHLRETGHGGNVCSLCWVELDDTSELKIHLTLHNHPKPFFCIYCNTRFRTKSLLSQHLPGHMCEKPHICPHCQKAFKRKHGLNSHLITHSKEPKHLCDECGFSTNHARILRAHKITHTGDFFKCSFPNCSHRTSRKENMKQHLKTHSKEKPFICELCGHKFSQKKSLRRHSMIHSNKNLENICPHCSFRARRVDNLKAHILRQHTEKLPKVDFKTSTDELEVEYTENTSELIINSKHKDF